MDEKPSISYRLLDGVHYIGGYAGMGEADAMPTDGARKSAVLRLLERGLIHEGGPTGGYHRLKASEGTGGLYVSGTGQWIRGKKLVLSDRLEKIYSRAVKVFQNEANAAAWLREPNKYLDGESPLAALATDFGTTLVVDILNRMEYGVYA